MVSRELFKLPRAFILFAEVVMVTLWAVMAFWGVMFIVKGLFDYTSLFVSDRVYGLLFTVIGVGLILTVRSYAYRVKRTGFSKLVVGFFNNRFLEIITTAILMLLTALIVLNNIYFVLTNLFILPIAIGTTFSVMLGLFLTHSIGIPFAPFIILASTWFLQVFWMYFFARIIVKIILLFRLRSNID